MKNIELKDEPTFAKLLSSVDEDLGRDDDSLNLFEWVVEDHYEEIIKESLKFFNERPDLIYISNEQIMFELNKMLDHFEYKEDYEKCARILTVKQYIADTIKNIK